MLLDPGIVPVSVIVLDKNREFNYIGIFSSKTAFILYYFKFIFKIVHITALMCTIHASFMY